jgi:hypothetical protein
MSKQEIIDELLRERGLSRKYQGNQNYCFMKYIENGAK